MTGSTPRSPEIEASWPPENFTPEDMLALVRGIAAFDGAGAHLAGVSAQRVSDATQRAHRLLRPHLEHDRPRKGACSALLGRAVLGVRDDDLRLAAAWLDAAPLLLPNDHVKGD